MTVQAKPTKIAGTFYWCSFAKPNDMSNKYQFDLGNLSEKAVKAFEDMGIGVKHKEDKGNYVTFKSTRPIESVDDAGNVITSREGEVVSLVGNGSKGYVVAGYYDWEFKGKKGRSPSARKVVIQDLIKYESEGSVEEDVL
jgi:hypothetical protein